MGYHDYDDDPPEHECPRALEEPASTFDVGGMVFTPAGRWETITDRTPFAEFSARIVVHTDRTGPDYAWTFWPSTKLPYLPAWRLSQPARIVVFEFDSMTKVEVTAARSCGCGHTLVTARQVRGAGWQITDNADGASLVSVSVPNKARARSEVNRRARAHGRRLGLTVEHADPGRGW